MSTMRTRKKQSNIVIDEVIDLDEKEFIDKLAAVASRFCMKVHSIKVIILL
jgi:hypothetical protein